MTKHIKHSVELLKSAAAYAIVQERTISELVEYWAQIGKGAEENPDLTFGVCKS